MRDYYNDPPEPDIAPEDEAIWEILESAGTDEETIKKVSAIVNGLLCEIGRLRNLGESKEYSLSTEAQPEVTGAVAYLDYNGVLKPTRDGVINMKKGDNLYPPSAIEAAVREKLEEAAYKCENMADKIGDMNTYNNSCESCCDNSAMRMAYDCAEAIRALVESPQPSVEEPAN